MLKKILLIIYNNLHSNNFEENKEIRNEKKNEQANSYNMENEFQTSPNFKPELNDDMLNIILKMLIETSNYRLFYQSFDTINVIHTLLKEKLS